MCGLPTGVLNWNNIRAIIGAEEPDFYHSYEVKLNTVLGIYLKDKNLLSNENRISLTKVLSIIDTEIVENKLSYVQNPEIIVCNTFLSNILRVRSCHRGQILDLLTISFTDLEF